MPVRAVTPLVVKHPIVLPQGADANGYDRWRDELAVPDPYDPDFEPEYSHGLIHPSEDLAATRSSAASPSSTSASPTERAGRLSTADAREASPLPRLAGSRSPTLPA